MAAAALERLRKVYMRVGGCCVFCGRALRLHEAHLDHEQGAAAVADAPEGELHCSCSDCRTEKGERTSAEYRHLRRSRLAAEMLALLGTR